MPTSVSLKLPPVDLNSHFFMKIVRSVVCGVVLFVALEFRLFMNREERSHCCGVALAILASVTCMLASQNKEV